MQLQILCSFCSALSRSMGLWVSLARCPASSDSDLAAAGSEFMHMTLVIDIISWLAIRARKRKRNAHKNAGWRSRGKGEEEEPEEIPRFLRRLIVCEVCSRCSGQMRKFVRGEEEAGEQVDQVIITVSVYVSPSSPSSSHRGICQIFHLIRRRPMLGMENCRR